MGEVKPVLHRWEVMPGSSIVRVVVRIGEKTYSYYMADSVPLRKILNGKYFGFRQMIWLKRNQIYLPVD